MEIIYSPRFQKGYKKLPVRTKELIEKKEKIFRNNPFDHRLKTHKLRGPLADFYAWSVNDQYRIIFEFIDGGIVRLYDVGTHDIYE